MIFDKLPSFLFVTIVQSYTAHYVTIVVLIDIISLYEQVSVIFTYILDMVWV
jgi:hypothetical protein